MAMASVTALATSIPPFGNWSCDPTVGCPDGPCPPENFTATAGVQSATIRWDSAVSDWRSHEQQIAPRFVTSDEVDQQIRAETTPSLDDVSHRSENFGTFDLVVHVSAEPDADGTYRVVDYEAVSR